MKNGQNKKFDRRHLGSCCHHGGEIVNAANIKKALANSLPIFSQKGPDFHSRTGFCLGASFQFRTASYVQDAFAV